MSESRFKGRALAFFGLSGQRCDVEAMFDKAALSDVPSEATFRKAIYLCGRYAE